MLDLWTKHDPLFNPLEKLNHKKTLMNDEFFMKPYNWLFNEIGTDQVIWTYATDKFLGHTHGSENKIWHLKVPNDAIVAIINDEHWNSVLNGHAAYDEYDFDTLVGEAPTDDDKSWSDLFDQFLREMEDKFGGLENNWKHFVLSKNNSLEDNQILIPCPIQRDWIVECIHCSDYDLEKIDDGICNMVFPTKDKRDHHIEVMKSLLSNRNFTCEIQDYANEDYEYAVCFKWEVD